MEWLSQVNSAVNGVVWGVPMIILILGTGIYMTLRSKGFQFRKIKYIAGNTILALFRKKSVKKTTDKKAISQFQAMTTALASTIGTGNIAGVAAAIAAGGPGAVFWMWVSALFGMMTSYSENVLGVYYRKKNKDGEWCGGAMYYLENGLKEKKGLKHLAKPLAAAFAIFCMLASLGIGNMTQVNSIASSLNTAFMPLFGISVPYLVTGAVLAVITALVILGGIKRIGNVTEKLVPIMAFAYIFAALYIFFSNFTQIPYVFGSIFKGALSFEAIGGGIGGFVIKQAIEMGFKRGIFSNEAGLGSSVMAGASSDVKEPSIQGMWGIFQVFADTIIVCTLTAFVLLSATAQNAVPLDTALQNISSETQYVKISDSSEDVVPLVDLHAASIIKDESSEASADDYVFTNIMSLKGVPQKDADNHIMYDENGKEIIESVKLEKLNGVPLVTYAFAQRFGDAAGPILAIAILMFAFSTVLGWSFYGVKATEYLFGTKATIIYKIIYIAAVLGGATLSLDLVWEISDTLNGLMALPNLIGILALSGTVIKITTNFIKRKACSKPEKTLVPMLSAYDDIQDEQLSALMKADDLYKK